MRHTIITEGVVVYPCYFYDVEGMSSRAFYILGILFWFSLLFKIRGVSRQSVPTGTMLVR
jgi:hypothetical protein